MYEVMVWPVAADVSSTGTSTSVTVTVSEIWPTLRVTVMLDVSVTRTITFSAMNLAKPGAVTSMR